MDEAEGIMTGRDRKERKQLFKAINNGDYEDLSTFTVASQYSGQSFQKDIYRKTYVQDARKINLRISRRNSKSNGRKTVPRKQKIKRSASGPGWKLLLIP